MKIKVSRFGINNSTAFMGLYSTFILEKVYLIAENPLLFSVIDMLQWLFLVFFAYKLLKRHYSSKLLLIAAIVIGIFGISYYQCKQSNYLKFALIIIASVGISYDFFYRDIRRTYIMWLIPILLLGMAGILPSTIVRRGVSTYGFIHVNIIAMFVLSSIACYLIEKQGKLSTKQYLAIIVIDAALWILTDTRSACLVILLLVVMNLLFQTKWFTRFAKTKISRIIFCAAIPICMIFSFYLAINYGSNSLFIDSMNQITSNRIYMANIVFTRMTPTLFGSFIQGDLVENAYIISIYQYGIIPSILVFGYYCFALIKALKRKEYAVLAVLISFVVIGIIEGVTFEPFVNIALVPAVFRLSLQKNAFRRNYDNNIYTNIQ